MDEFSKGIAHKRDDANMLSPWLYVILPLWVIIYLDDIELRYIGWKAVDTPTTPWCYLANMLSAWEYMILVDLGHVT